MSEVSFLAWFGCYPSQTKNGKVPALPAWGRAVCELGIVLGLGCVSPNPNQERKNARAPLLGGELTMAVGSPGTVSSSRKQGGRAHQSRDNSVLGVTEYSSVAAFVHAPRCLGEEDNVPGAPRAIGSLPPIS